MDPVSAGAAVGSLDKTLWTTMWATVQFVGAYIWNRYGLLPVTTFILGFLFASKKSVVFSSLSKYFMYILLASVIIILVLAYNVGGVTETLFGTTVELAVL